MTQKHGRSGILPYPLACKGIGASVCVADRLHTPTHDQVNLDHLEYQSRDVMPQDSQINSIRPGRAV